MLLLLLLHLHLLPVAGAVKTTKQGVDLLIADTSGRLHTNVNLMKELEKVHVEY